MLLGLFAAMISYCCNLCSVFPGLFPSLLCMSYERLGTTPTNHRPLCFRDWGIWAMQFYICAFLERRQSHKSLPLPLRSAKSPIGSRNGCLVPHSVCGVHKATVCSLFRLSCRFRGNSYQGYLNGPCNPLSALRAWIFRLSCTGTVIASPNGLRFAEPSRVPC